MALLAGCGKLKLPSSTHYQPGFTILAGHPFHSSFLSLDDCTVLYATVYTMLWFTPSIFLQGGWSLLALHSSALVSSSSSSLSVPGMKAVSTDSFLPISVALLEPTLPEPKSLSSRAVSVWNQSDPCTETQFAFECRANVTYALQCNTCSSFIAG